MKIAIIDVLGLPYDGRTVYQRGLGGSESAVTYLSEELVRVGFSVTVFNECNADDCSPGVYNGVNYQPLVRLKDHDCDFDIVISSRSVEPWVPSHLRDAITLKVDPSVFERIQGCSHKILWLHDTFCYGDHLLEQLVVNNHINELFVLSDWHMSYVLNCDHGRRRNYEVLKNKTWITRNGVRNWLDWVDISQKNPTQFVYNSSVSKGMAPLLQRIWPRVREHIPDATLKIVGGYYKFRSDQEPDEQEQHWHTLRQTYDLQNGVEFLGIITQQQIAQVLAHSTFMLYPAAFPETFGISCLESINYNTPLITCRFGALEETALDMSCYKIDYAIEPNNLFPDIVSDRQVDQFVELVLSAHHNRYLLQQKQHYCSIVRDVVGWDHVALQWKQHFYRLKDSPLSVEEFQQVSTVQQRLGQIFGRRTVNPEDRQLYHKPEQQIVVISPFYNAQDYISRSIISVATQSYSNYLHVLIDDASTDGSAEIAVQTINSCPLATRSKFHLLRNGTNRGAVYNHHQALEWCRDQGIDSGAIIMLLDGDDWLVNRNDIFSHFNLHFEGNTEFSYGSCWSLADGIPLIAQEYPPEIREAKSYRDYQFNWILPYTHMRAFRFDLFNKVDINLWQDSNGEWFGAGGDTAVFYSLLEAADPLKVKVMKDIVVNYNDLNPINDYKIRNQQQLTNAHEVLNQKKSHTPISQTPSQITTAVADLQCESLAAPLVAKTKRILIGIPTAKYIEAETFKSIYDLKKPPGTELSFQYFWGYNVEQVRNIMVAYTLRNNFDYLFSVDSDIILTDTSLTRLLHCQDSVRAVSSGVYIQRKEGERIPEIYVTNPHTGGQQNIHIDDVQDDCVIDVAAVGFGCCLVRKDVFERVGNPWFVYRSNIDFTKVVSEDVDFCVKASEQGYKIVVDTGVKVTHISKQYLHVTSSK